MKTSITVTASSVNWANYLDWILAGWAAMAERGEMEPVRFRLPPLTGALIRHSALRYVTRRAAPTMFKRLAAGSGGVMEGEIRFGDRTVRFAYDIIDEPWDYNLAAFERCDLYFKAQTGLNSPAPFPLSRRISMPLPKAVVEGWSKVRRAMLGRPLARSLNGKKNLAALKRWESSGTGTRNLSLFAYYGSMNPHQLLEQTLNGERFLHPNAKRVDLVKGLRAWNDPRVDARIVTGGPPETAGPFIPLADYPGRVASTCYNVNVSGNGNSIPFRFVDSFSLGTAIATDDQVVGWYAPFDEEVEMVSFGKLGYELAEEADLPGALRRLREMADTDPGKWGERADFIRERFRRLWHPEAFARYFVEECRKAA